MKTQHTKGPWYALGTDVKADGDPLNDTGLMLADCSYDRFDSSGEANAAFIVRACNSFDDLLKAAKFAVSEIGRPTHVCTSDKDGYADDCYVCCLEKAIAKAEGTNE